MTKDQLQTACIEAFELLAKGRAEDDLIDSEEWEARADLWLNTYPPSLVAAAEPFDTRMDSLLKVIRENGAEFDAWLATVKSGVAR